MEAIQQLYPVIPLEHYSISSCHGNSFLFGYYLIRAFFYFGTEMPLMSAYILKCKTQCFRSLPNKWVVSPCLGNLKVIVTVFSVLYRMHLRSLSRTLIVALLLRDCNIIRLMIQFDKCDI